jgi:flagellar biosynthesis/type III secretory pathway protein FliH
MSRILKSVNFEPHRSVTVEPIRILSSASPALSPVNIGVADNGTESAALVNEAQAHVETMLNQARMEVSAWQEEARQEGWRAGYAEARQAAEAELAEALTKARSLAQSAIEGRSQFLDDVQLEIGRLAIAIAERIIGKELSINPSSVTDIVAQVIEKADVQGACRIHVNPQDYEVLIPHWEAIAPLQQGDSRWDLVPNQRLGRGGCLIESGGGTVDGKLQTQLAQVELAFEEMGA